MAGQPSDLRICEHLSGAMSAHVHLPQHQHPDPLSDPLRADGGADLFPGCLLPAEDPRPDHGGGADPAADSSGGGAACLQLHLRQSHAHQPGADGRRRGDKLRPADPLRHPEKHSAHPAASGPADRAGADPDPPEGPQIPAALASGPVFLRNSSGSDRADCRSDGHGKGRALLRL